MQESTVRCAQPLCKKTHREKLHKVRALLNTLYRHPDFQEARKTMKDEPSNALALMRIVSTQIAPVSREEEEANERDRLMWTAVHNWMRDCDPRVVTPLGSDATLMPHEAYLRNLAVCDYYAPHYIDPDGALNDARLLYDWALCRGVCPVVVMHLVATLLFHSNSQKQASAVLSVLCHCLRRRLDIHPHCDTIKLPLLLRIIALGSCDDQAGINQLPEKAYNFVAAMYCRDVVFLAIPSTQQDELAPSCPLGWLSPIGDEFENLIYASVHSPEQLTRLKTHDDDFRRRALGLRAEIVGTVNEWLRTHSDVQPFCEARLQLRDITM